MKAQMIDDYLRVAALVNGEDSDNKNIKRADYRQHGRYSDSAFINAFGTFTRFKESATSNETVDMDDENYVDVALVGQHTKIFKLKNTVKTLKKENRILHEMNMYKSNIDNIVKDIVKDKLVVDIKKYKPIKISKTNDNEAILIASDFHYGSIIKPSTMNYQNEFNSDIARKRIDRLFKTHISYVTKNHITTSHIISLGDQISGSIHNELAISNEKYDTEATHEVASMFIDFLIELSQIQKVVNFKCYVGNHARLTKEKTHKSKITENMEYLMGKIIEQTFKVLRQQGICKNVNIEVPESPYTIENINGVRFLFTHGDIMLNSNKGVRVMRNITTMAQGFKQLDLDFDVAVCGHFHSFAVYSLNKRKLIINSSLCGPDEYARSLGIMSNEASQTILKVTKNKLDEIKLIEFK